MLPTFKNTRPKSMEEVKEDDSVVRIHDFDAQDYHQLARMSKIKHLQFDYIRFPLDDPEPVLPKFLETFALYSFLPASHLQSFFSCLNSLVSLQTLVFEGSNIGSSLPLVASTLKNLVSLRKLVIGSDQFENIPLEFASALTKLTLLEELVFVFDGINGNQLRVLAPAFQTMSKLRVLNLRGNGLQYDDAVFLLEPLQNLESLQELSLSYNRISFTEPPTQGRRILGTALQNLVRLKTLDLGTTCMIPRSLEEIAMAIPKLQCLEALDLQFNKMGEIGISLFVEHLQTCEQHSLKRLVLSSNELNTATAAEKVSTWMGKLPNLRELVLSGNKFLLDVQGAEFFTKALRNMKILELLDLTGCGIGCRPDMIVPVLRSLSSLKILILKNAPVETATSSAFAEIGFPENLEELDLSNVGLEREQVELLGPALCRLKYLRTLKLSRTCMDKETQVSLVSILKDLGNLETLDLNSNGIDKEVVRVLASTLGSLPKIRLVDLSINYLSRTSIFTLAFHLVDFEGMNGQGILVDKLFQLSQARFKLFTVLCSLRSDRSRSHMRILPLDILKRVCTRLVSTSSVFTTDANKIILL